MPSRASKRPKLPRDTNEMAAAIVRMTTGQEPKPAEPEKNPAAVALSKLGASKGGKARAAKLSRAQRSAIAKKAAAKRWGQNRNSRD